MPSDELGNECLRANQAADCGPSRTNDALPDLAHRKSNTYFYLRFHMGILLWRPGTPIALIFVPKPSGIF